jgi:hypothetical protein
MKRHFFAVMLASAACAAQAQVYRCGQTYSQKPCPEGKLIDSSDPRSAAQRAEAKRAVAKDKQLAADLERERRQRESAIAPGAATLTAVPGAPAASKPVPVKTRAKSRTKKHRPATDKDFSAVVPASKAGSR